MRKSLFILLLILSLPLRAQWASFNIDIKTTMAISSALATENGQEELSRESLDKILDHYTNAEVATAGIFASKWLDRKAMTNVGLFDNTEENYYYKRIYTMVSSRIMPKILDVAQLMIKRPDLALYWGPYLYKVTTDVKQLCMQFESVVANGKLTFQDIAFLAINDQLSSLFDMSRLAGVDWAGLWDNLVNFNSGITKEDLSGDLETLLSAGSAIATAGGNSLDSLWVNASSVGNIFQSKPKEIMNMLTDFATIYEDFSNPESIKQTIMGQIGDGGVSNLFKLDDYNLTNYISNYLNEMSGRYYKQRWYVYWHESGRELLAEWEPCDNSTEIGKSSVANGTNGWYKVNTNDKYYSPSQSDLDAAKAAAHNACGWSQDYCDQLNSQQDWYHYYFTYSLRSYYLYRGDKNNVVGYSYSYAVAVYRSWDGGEEVYEEWFDSQTQALAPFKAHMDAKCQEISAEDEIATKSDTPQHTYKVGCDSPQYYSTTDSKKLQNAVSVSYTLNCNDGGKLGEGNFQWKVNPSHSPLNDKSKEYAMSTTLEPDGLNVKEFDDKIQESNEKINSLNAQISSLEEENKQLLVEIGKADVGEAASLREKYDANKSKISSLQDQLSNVKNELEQLKECRQQALDDFAGETDGCYRIPAVMHEIETNYQVEWIDEGTWVGYTFVRRCNVPSMKGIAEFSATLSKVRGESHFLGIRFHRSIIGVTWKLTTNYSTSDVIEVMKLDPNMSDSERVNLVNRRQSELQGEYPDCTVEISYEYNNPKIVEDTEDTYHLLWVSDRLAIAREIDYRLTSIYSNLVLCEKFLSTRETILEYLKGQLNHVLFEGLQGRHSTEAYRRWRDNSKKALHLNTGSIYSTN